MAEIDIYDIIPRVTLTKIEVPARERPEEDAEEKPEGKEKDSGADGHLPESGEAREKKPAEVRSGSSGSAKRIIIAVLVADILFVLFVLCWILFVGV